MIDDPEAPVMWLCKGCGAHTKLRPGDVRSRPCSDCGGVVFFADCNTVVIGIAAHQQARDFEAWLARWSIDMAAKRAAA